jgi:ribosomal protein L2
MKNSGIKNLIPLNKRTKDEQRAIAKNGGKASGKARLKKKYMKEIYFDFLLKQSGQKKIKDAVNQIISDPRATSQVARVSMIKEVREATEDKEIDLSKFLSSL